MSKVVKNDNKKAVERRNQAMKRNYTKVKPTVVKHVLPNEVMQIQNPSVSYFLVVTLFSAQVHQN